MKAIHKLMMASAVAFQHLHLFTIGRLPAQAAAERTRWHY